MCLTAGWHCHPFKPSYVRCADQVLRHGTSSILPCQPGAVLMATKYLSEQRVDYDVLTKSVHRAYTVAYMHAGFGSVSS